MDDLIKREDAIEAVCGVVIDAFGVPPTWGYEVAEKALSTLPSAEANPTVIRSKTLLPTKDFKEWAKRIKEVNPNAVVISCDAEVASAEAVQGEWTYLSGSIGSYMTISCPICGSTFDGVAEWKYHFCPNCGARMNKGGDDE